MKIDIGCGLQPEPGYTSVDLFTPADIKDDIRTLATFADNSVEEVRTFHILEHLTDTDVLPSMRAIYRVLAHEGKWIIEVPDLIWVVQDFLNTPEEGRWGWKMQTLFGLQNHEGEFHKTGFSAERMRIMLTEVGFVDIVVTSVFSNKYNQGVVDATAVRP